MSRVRAFAKINLSLRVLGMRADGYHELRTIFQSIALLDTLTVRAARGPDGPAAVIAESDRLADAARAAGDRMIRNIVGCMTG